MPLPEHPAASHFCCHSILSTNVSKHLRNRWFENLLFRGWHSGAVFLLIVASAGSPVALCFAAASEVIYSALKELNYDGNLSSSIATQFYTGIVTDTGSFRHSSTTSNSHLVASELLSLGAELTNVHKNLHENSTFQKIKFLGYMIAEKFVFVEEHNYGYAIINEVDFKKFDASYEDIESVINQAMSINSLKLFILAKQNHEGYRISLRSKDNLDCRQIAHEFFSGGGHINASGGIYNGTDKDLVKYISSIPFDMY